MKSFFTTLITLSLLLTACNMPTKVITPTSDKGLLLTAVSSTLTAIPVLPTTITLNTQSTETSTPTSAASPTESITATSTFTPTLTTTPASFKTSLGTPIWQNHLDDGKSFGISPAGYQDDNTHIVIANGMMNLSSNSTVGFRSWRLASPTPRDFYLEGVFKSAACGNNDQFGLVFRAPDYSSGFGYYFGITCNGTYSLYKWNTVGAAVILNGSSAAINPGINQTNAIGIKAQGNNFTFYMNDKVLQTFTDDSLTETGHLGVFVGAYSGNLSVGLDDIAYWNLP
jgi:hypothetical protein